MQSITEYYRVLQSITEYYRALQCITEYNKVLQSITECYRVLQSIAEYYKVIQSITKYYKDKSSASTLTNFWACLFGNVYDRIILIPQFFSLCFVSACVCKRGAGTFPV